MHNRKFVPSGVACVVGRLRNSMKAMDQDYIESLIIESNFLEEAPFKWVGLIYRYGLKNDYKKPWYGRINKKYGDIPVAVEIKMDVLQAADQLPHAVEVLRQIFLLTALDCLIHIGHKYKLPTAAFEQERAKYGEVPETSEEVKALGEKGLLIRKY